MKSAKFVKGEEAWMDTLFRGRIKVKIVRNESKIPEGIISPDGRVVIREVHAYTVVEVDDKRRWVLVPETALRRTEIEINV
jgi:hypothetical protein